MQEAEELDKKHEFFLPDESFGDDRVKNSTLKSNTDA